MTTALYTAEARVTGGRNGQARTSNGELELELRQPTELGGDGKGTNPEELFAIGYAACFGTTLSLVAQAAGLPDANPEIDAKVALHPTASAGYRLAAELRITLADFPADQAVDLVRTAHQICPYSNATRDNIEVILIVNGTTL